MQRISVGTTVALGFASIALLAAAGCRGSQPAPETQSSPQASPSPSPQNPAEAAQQMAQGLQQLGQAQAKPVDFEHLVALLPEPAEWARSKPRGEQISMGVSISKAEAEYTKGDSTIRLEITDTSFSQLLMAPLSMMLMTGYSERSTDGYKKYAAIGGSPGFETWENEPKDGEVTAVVANRFIVNAKGNNVPNIEAVRSLVQAIDFGKLAGLK